jgi:hypothetical protein
MTPTEIGELVTVTVLLLTALANYFNHLALMEVSHNTQTILDGQAKQLTAVAQTLSNQASYAAGQQSGNPPPSTIPTANSPQNGVH